MKFVVINFGIIETWCHCCDGECDISHSNQLRLYNERKFVLYIWSSMWTCHIQQVDKFHVISLQFIYSDCSLILSLKRKSKENNVESGQIILVDT